MGCFDTLRLFVRSRPGHPCVQQHERQPPTEDSFAGPTTALKKPMTIVRCVAVREDELLDETTTGGKELYKSVRHDTDLSRPLSPVVEELRSLIENDALIHRLFTNMFREIPRRPSFDMDPSGHPQIRDYKTLLRHLNGIIGGAPTFDTTNLKGFPINAILALPMATPSGIAAFLNAKVNEQIRRILDTWAIFLSSPESRYVLNADPNKGWLGAKALASMPNFTDDYVCSPDEPYFGFRSWDDFFTRKLRNGVRRVDYPNDNTVIVNACESQPYRLATGVKAHDQFWIKDQSYSLLDMLAGDALAYNFHGGTVYQAYLGCTNYHRWHSPVSGTIRKAYGKAGAYYAQAPSIGFDKSTPNASQAYLSHVATRAMIFIDADDSNIGLMCFMPVGIAECSSCEVRVSAGQRVEKGDEIGMFHYGGSTYCLIFRRETKLRFKEEAATAGADSPVLRVNSILAQASQS